MLDIKLQSISQDIDKFLKDQFDEAFTRCFADFETFKKVMVPDARQCEHCRCWHWKGTEKKCDCDYLENLKSRITNEKPW